MTAVRLVIAGRVQGVGFRDWLVQEATRRGVHGWVRNRGDGSVETLLHGDQQSLADLLVACRRGPRFAAVTDVAEYPADPPGIAEFRRLPTA
jgi:acylphosphatase